MTRVTPARWLQPRAAALLAAAGMVLAAPPACATYGLAT
jgi:hypothetical protein